IIPQQNVKNLMLKDEVITAVQEENFHIYAINHIVEGIGILTNMPIDDKDKAGNYTLTSLYGKVTNQLEKYATIIQHKKEKPDNSSEAYDGAQNYCLIMFCLKKGH